MLPGLDEETPEVIKGAFCVDKDAADAAACRASRLAANNAAVIGRPVSSCARTSGASTAFDCGEDVAGVEADPDEVVDKFARPARRAASATRSAANCASRVLFSMDCSGRIGMKAVVDKGRVDEIDSV